MHSHFETQEQMARSEQLHKNIGLSASDHEIYDRALKNLPQQYDILVSTHELFVEANTSKPSMWMTAGFHWTR
jgi:hypothetical protein